MGSHENQKIGSITTFIARLASLGLDKPSEDVFYFRGHSDHEKYKLEPSIYREPEWVENEHRMFREIIMKCPDDFRNTRTTFERLVKMQHYSLPTRLLDLTGNPLAALLFTVNGSSDKDGEVLIFRVPKNEVKYYDSDTVSVLSNISKRPAEFDITKIKNKRKTFSKQELGSDVGVILIKNNNSYKIIQGIGTDVDLIVDINGFY